MTDLPYSSLEVSQLTGVTLRNWRGKFLAAGTEPGQILSAASASVVPVVLVELPK